MTDAETERKGTGNILERSRELRVKESRIWELWVSRCDSGRAWRKTQLTGQQGGRWRKCSFIRFLVFVGDFLPLCVSLSCEMVSFPDANVWSGIDAKPHLLQTLGNAVTPCRPANVQIHPQEWLGEDGGIGRGEVEEAKVKECTPPWTSSKFKKYSVYYLIFLLWKEKQTEPKPSNWICKWKPKWRGKCYVTIS